MLALACRPLSNTCVPWVCMRVVSGIPSILASSQILFMVSSASTSFFFLRSSEQLRGRFDLHHGH